MVNIQHFYFSDAKEKFVLKQKSYIKMNIEYILCLVEQLININYKDLPPFYWYFPMTIFSTLNN